MGPKCQGAAAKAWLAERQAELLGVPSFHVVFTLPAAIADIAYQNKAVIYDILFKAARRDPDRHRRQSSRSGSQAHDPDHPARHPDATRLDRRFATGGAARPRSRPRRKPCPSRLPIVIRPAAIRTSRKI